MSRVEEIEAAIDGLSPEEYRHIVQWFQARDRERWPMDAQLDSDSSTGKLDFLFNEADAIPGIACTNRERMCYNVLREDGSI
jgi:hypothetical protein